MTTTTTRLDPALRRTLLAALATGLGILPLKNLFFDDGWLVDVWLTVALVIGPAALLRLRRAPGALDIWPGVILLVPWLTGRFLSAHAWLGFIPTTGTWNDLSLLMTELHKTTRESVSPIHTTIAVRLVVCALIGLLAALVDLIAVVGRRGALGGVPLLVVFTVAGAVPRKPVSWVWFAAAALGFLILLAIDSDDDLAQWGRRITTTSRERPRRSLGVSGQRIAVAAVAVAVAIPLLVPGNPRNLIANAFHNGGGGGVGGFGGSGGGSITPFAALKNQLNRTTPIPLMDVHITSARVSVPFYLRVNVLEKYTDAGWSVSDHGQTEPLDQTNFGAEPEGDGVINKLDLEARIKVTGLTGNAPVFAVPRQIRGLDTNATWSPKDQLVLGQKLERGAEFVERFSQPSPTLNQLRAAGGRADPSLGRLLELPTNFPVYARNLVDKLIADAPGPYAAARAISDYFTNPRSGFVYDLKTKPGDSGSDLVDFLQNKVGFCQQYAASMAIMLRAAGIPARVVLGYMHPLPDSGGDFTVTTAQAHSWVEAHFPGVGWIPFDPTPTAGLAGGARSDLVWAPHDYPRGSSNTQDVPTKPSTSVRPSPAATSSSAGTTAQAAAPRDGSSQWPWLLGVLVGIAGLSLVSAGVRSGRRRQRYDAGTRDADADALWAELSDTAVDLGYVWTPSRSPRQVATWLSHDLAGAEPALTALAVAVERRRYAPPSGDEGAVDRLTGELDQVVTLMRAGRSRSVRLRAWLWPASLGWGRRSPWRRRRR